MLWSEERAAIMRRLATEGSMRPMDELATDCLLFACQQAIGDGLTAYPAQAARWLAKEPQRDPARLDAIGRAILDGPIPGEARRAALHGAFSMARAWPGYQALSI